MNQVAQLTRAIARGDTAAFGTFYEAWFDRCYALARARTGRDEAFCFDVVQECMMRVVRKIVVLETEAALAAWMMRVVETTAFDLLRAEERRARRERRVAESRPEAVTAADPGARLEENERARWLAERLAEASSAERALIVARYEKGQTLEGAGARLGISGDAAHGRVHRLIQKLKCMAREVFRE